MTLEKEWIAYGEKGQFKAYVSRLSALAEPAPAVIVIQEIWGVDAHIRDVADRLAAAGYVAFAPDLFAVDGERPAGLTEERIEQAKQLLNTLPPGAWRSPEARKDALSALPEEEAQATEETLNGILSAAGKREDYLGQVVAAAAFLRDEYNSTKGQGVASVGFCLGGALSALLAAKDSELKGAVLFYGSFPDEEQAASIKAPLLGFYGELDSRITDAAPAFADTIGKIGQSFEYHVYPGAQHAFFNDTRPSYQAAAARDAFARTLVFLNKYLSN